jgi:CRP/FNR family cyclic AMP-dependent transcriptional regulator
MSVDLTEQRLADHPFLRGLTEEQLKVLEDCSMKRVFEPGEVIFREGDLANRFYLILSGSVALEAPRVEDGPVRIETLGAGDVLGWSWLFPPYSWHFDARALERTEAIFLYGTRIRAKCEEQPALGYELIKRVSMVLMNRLQATRKELIKSVQKLEHKSA